MEKGDSLTEKSSLTGNIPAQTTNKNVPVNIYNYLSMFIAAYRFLRLANMRNKQKYVVL